jgi:hypothetical protein
LRYVAIILGGGLLREKYLKCDRGVIELTSWKIHVSKG